MASQKRKQRQERNRQPVSGRLYASHERGRDCPEVLQLGKNMCERDSRGPGRRRPLRDGCVKNTLSQISHSLLSTSLPAPPPWRLVHGKQGGLLFTACRHVKVRHVKVLLLMALPNGVSRRRPRQTTGGASAIPPPPTLSTALAYAFRHNFPAGEGCKDEAVATSRSDTKKCVWATGILGQE